MTQPPPAEVRPRRGPSQRLFARWVDWIGGGVQAAKRLKCSAGMISHLKTERKLPGRDLATRIQREVEKSGWDHAILATRWTK